MNSDGTSTPATPPQSPRQPTASRRNNVYKSLFIAVGAIAFSVTALVTVLSRVNPSVLSQALTTFRGWPFPLQALGVLAALVVIAVLALWYPVRQTIDDRQQQRNISIGMQEALENTATDDVPQIRTTLTSIYGLLVETFLGDNSTRRQPQAGDLAPREAPEVLPAGDAPSEAVKPQDDAQFAPPDIFIGRHDELAWLEERLKSHQGDKDTTAIIGITGMGKTALASKAIDRIKNHNFADGIARVQCAGMHNPVEIVRHSLERVDPGRRLPPTGNLDVLHEVSEELLGGKDILIVLDGIEPDVQVGLVVRALRTKERSAHILITTTTSITPPLSTAENQLSLKPLKVIRGADGAETDEALELFARYAGMDSAKELGNHTDAAKAIVAALERHTYSIQLIGGYVQGQSDILPGLADDITRLKEGALPPGIDGILKPVWAAITTTVNALPPDARRLLFAIGAFGTEEAGRPAVQRVGMSLDLSDTDGSIRTIVQRELMESFETSTMPSDSDRNRLKIHALLHVYIARSLASSAWADDQRVAKDAIASYYAEYSQRYDRSDPSRNTQRALTPDAANITHALDWAIERNQHAIVTILTHSMRRYWYDRWQNETSLRYLPTGVDAAELLVSRARLAKNDAEVRVNLERAANLAFVHGRVLRRAGRLAEAEPYFKRELRFRRRHQPREYVAEAEALYQLAQLERSRGNMRKALRYCNKGLSILRWHSRAYAGSITRYSDEYALPFALLYAQKGRIERSRGYLQKANRLFREALPLFEQVGDLREQGVVWGYLGRIARVRGDVREAESYFKQSNELARQVYDYRGEGVVATQLGRLERTRGVLVNAEGLFEDGYKKALQVLDRQAEAVNLNYLGRIAISRGQVARAEEYFKRSVHVAEEINDRLDYGVGLGYLGRIARQRENMRGARLNFLKALKILREVEDRRGQSLILAQLALVESDTRQFWRAHWHIWRSLRLIRKIGDKRSEGNNLMYLGQVYYAQRNLPAAKANLDRAIERARHVEDRDGEAEALLWLGMTVALNGDTEQAAHCYTTCRAIAKEAGNERIWAEADRRYTKPLSNV